MSKYIECKKILDFCNVVINRQGNEEEMNVVVESFKAFAEYVKALPPADVQPVVHWIPCSERLPDESNFYMVTNEYDEVEIIWFAHKDDYDIEKSEWRETEDKIIAWKEVPEPYRKGADQ